MHQKNFNSIVGVLFLIIAIVHLLRVLYHWEVMVNGWAVSMWASWVGIVVAAALAYHGLRLSRK